MDAVILNFKTGFDSSYAREAVLFCEFEKRLFAIDEVVVGKGFLQFSDFRHHLLCDGDGIVATHCLAEGRFQFR